MFESLPGGATPARETALACVRAGIAAAHPDRVVADGVDLDGDRLRVGDATYDLGAYDEVVVVGGGKAAGAVATALERVLGERIAAGAVVTIDPDEGADDGGAATGDAAADDPATGEAPPDAPERIERHYGSHPVPDERGVAGAERVRELVEAAGERTLVLAVVTGGGSALLPAPADEVGLADLRATTDRLLAAGADIDEINAVRAHLSALKGGGLADAATPATVVGLVLSDVVGDDLAVVASGPTAPDPSTFADALAVLDRYGVDAPDAVRRRLERGAAGEIPETPGPDDPAFDRVENRMLGTAYTALDAARAVARERGYDTCLLSSRVRGEASEAARTHAAVALESAATGDPVAPPAVVLAGGECTVTVTGDGEGGPNLEFALSAALDLSDAEAGERVALAAVDTDGHDGGTTAAGGLVDGTTVTDPEAARAALDRNDALAALEADDAVLYTGATGTNVNDLRVAVVEADDGA
ncbi:MAG: glycerate kinase [Haloferacaceae archaeon]